MLVSDKKKLRSASVLVAKGFCMGTADVIPSVSGGTIAFILGIYSDLINAIKSFDKLWLNSLVKMEIGNITGRPHLWFLIPLFTGIFSALLFFIRVIPLPQLLVDYPEQIYAFFFGLIAGSILTLTYDVMIFSRQAVVPLAIGITFGTVVFNLAPIQTPETAWFIFISGCISICAIILPGISGSFILLMLNKYAYVLNAIGYFRLEVLIPFGLGAVTGLVVFSRILSYILTKHYQATVLAIIGILISSLWVIWPFQQHKYEIIRHKSHLIGSSPFIPDELTGTVLLSLLLIIVGFTIVYGINRFAITKNKSSD